MSTGLPFWDPHFHLIDVSAGSASGQDAQRLFEPDGEPVYSIDSYERDMDQAGPEFVPCGGAWLETMSVCHVDRPGAELGADCVVEARWAARRLAASTRDYVMVPSVALEAPNAAETLSTLASIPAVRGVRQILNHQPSWPRNERLGNLLENPRWVEGFARLAEHRLSFDLQLNPHQLVAAARLVDHSARFAVIIDHLGSPTFDDLRSESGPYWRGMRALAQCEQTTLKISMLHYARADWDETGIVPTAILRLIDLFGIHRCLFASNFPVESHAGWRAARLLRAFRGVYGDQFSPRELRWLFAENARRIYRAGEDR